MRFESIVLATLLLLTISVPAQAQDVRLNSIINVTFSANAQTPDREMTTVWPAVHSRTRGGLSRSKAKMWANSVEAKCNSECSLCLGR